MNDRQEMFCREYIIDFNATQAAIRAGYSEHTAHSIGSENLTKPELWNRVQTLILERKKRLSVTSDYVIAVIQDTLERCRELEPITDLVGNPIMVKTNRGEMAAVVRFNPKDVMKGCELLGKHLKMFTEKHELTGKDGAPLIPQELTEEALIEKLKKNGLPVELLES